MSHDFAPLSAHFDQLRALLIKVFIILTFGAFACFFASDKLLTLLKPSFIQSRQDHEIKIIRYQNLKDIPRKIDLPKDSEVKFFHKADLYPQTAEIRPGGWIDLAVLQNQEQLALFGPLEGFRVAFWISFTAGLILTAPFWIFPCLNFVYPALTPKERRSLWPLLALSTLFIGGGIMTTHQLSLPFMNRYFYDFNKTLGINLWGLENYLDYAIGMYLAHALLFEAALILLFLVHLGFITPRGLRKGRKGVYILALIIAGILTPPDVASQLFIAIPLIAVYEIAILYGTLKSMSRKSIYGRFTT